MRTKFSTNIITLLTNLEGNSIHKPDIIEKNPPLLFKIEGNL